MYNPKSVSEEIKKIYRYKIELHAHTSPASGCSQVKPDELVKAFAEAGYNGIAITNHFFIDNDNFKTKDCQIDMLKRDMEDSLEAGERYGVKIYTAAELRFYKEADNDYLFYGFDFDMLPEIYDYLETDLETFVKGFKTEDMLLIQAHPFRNDMKLMNPDLLDGMEAFNVHPNHNGRVAVAAKYAGEHGKIMTVGTDYHHPGHHGISATRTSVLPENTAELIKIIKSDDFVMDIGGKILI